MIYYRLFYHHLPFITIKNKVSSELNKIKLKKDHLLDCLRISCFEDLTYGLSSCSERKFSSSTYLLIS